MVRISVLLSIGFLQLAALSAQEVTIAPHQHAPMVIHDRHDHTVDSTNWSGYAVTAANGTVTDVKGSWIVPSVVCPGGSQYSSFWIGIDGYSSNTVEQIGTDSDCQNGTPTYYMWFEFYPHLSYTVPSFNVSPGDTISAEVEYTSGRFVVTITDVTQYSENNKNEKYQTSSKIPSAKRSSAEWIVEAPYSGGVLPLADFGESCFAFEADCHTVNTSYEDLATIGSSQNLAIGAFPSAAVQQINMVDSGGTLKDLTSYPLSSNTAFSVTWKSAN